MEMCPYCGEEVPETSGKCWKCGTELAEGSGAKKAPGGDEELDVPDEDEEGGGSSASAAPPLECPHCGSPVPKKAARCRECGRVVRAAPKSHAAKAWRLGTWVLVVGVGLAVSVAVIVASVKSRKAAERAKAISAPFENVNDKVKPLAKKTNEERRQEVWTKEFDRKFVRWSGTVVEIHPDDLEVHVAHVKGSQQTDVIVRFLDDSRDALSALKPGDPIVYSARLVEFGNGCAFTLTDGAVEKSGDAPAGGKPDVAPGGGKK